MASSSALLSRELGFFSTVSQSRLQSDEGRMCCSRHRSAGHSIFRQSLVSCQNLRKSGPANSKASSGGFVDRSRMISTASGAGRKVLVQATDSTEVSTEEMTEAEREGWEKRMEESKEAGTETPAFGDWKWTLNWNLITPEIAVGSCPRSASDMDRIVDEGGFDAVLNLQSDLCFDALEIPIDKIRSRAIERGVLLRRVPIRDFDHNDQALMLPEAIRALNVLVSRGKKVFVHCTAGINRATLTVVGYLTFVQGLGLEEAQTVVKRSRPIAHPYIDCWQVVRQRFLEGRDEQLTAMSRQIYDDRCVAGAHGNMKSDWKDAQTRLIAETFSRYLEVDQLAYELEQDIAARAIASQEPATSAPEPASTSNGNGAAHSAVLEEEEEADDADALECNVITRECVKADAAEVDEWESSLAPPEEQKTIAGAVK